MDEISLRRTVGNPNPSLGIGALHTLDTIEDRTLVTPDPRATTDSKPVMMFRRLAKEAGARWRLLSSIFAALNYERG